MRLTRANPLPPFFTRSSRTSSWKKSHAYINLLKGMRPHNIAMSKSLSFKIGKTVCISRSVAVHGTPIRRLDLPRYVSSTKCKHSMLRDAEGKKKQCNQQWCVLRRHGSSGIRQRRCRFCQDHNTTAIYVITATKSHWTLRSLLANNYVIYNFVLSTGRAVSASSVFGSALIFLFFLADTRWLPASSFLTPSIASLSTCRVVE
jgi:hypothetical protein